MATTGSVTLDFGSAPVNNTQASVAVTGQGSILTTSKVEAWVMPVDLAGTDGHSEDEHMIENLKVTVPVSTIIAGTGFTIQGECTLGTTNGKWTIQWVWN